MQVMEPFVPAERQDMTLDIAVMEPSEIVNSRRGSPCVLSCIGRR